MEICYRIQAFNQGHRRFVDISDLKSLASAHLVTIFEKGRWAFHSSQHKLEVLRMSTVFTGPELTFVQV